VGGRGRWRCAEGAAAKMAEALRDNPGKRAGGRGREAGAVYTPLLIVSIYIYIYIYIYMCVCVFGSWSGALICS
jgi:hypothetical protein